MPLALLVTGQVVPTDWVCPECEQENEGADEVCIACEEPRPAPEPEVDERYLGYKVGEPFTVTGAEEHRSDRPLELSFPYPNICACAVYRGDCRCGASGG